MNNFTNRKFIIGAIFLFVGLIFIIRLINIQLINNKYKLDSDSNVLRTITKYPARGLVYDRNGELLVYNEAAYDLMLIPKQLKEIDTNEFCKLFEITKAEFIERLTKIKKYSTYKPSVFEKEISTESYANIQDQLYKFPGFFVQLRTLRSYQNKNAAHILGYISEVTPAIIEKDNYYKSGDYIGKSGVELAYEELLRGKRGIKKVLVDVHNREKGSYLNGKEDTLSISGERLQISLDITLQTYGELLMQNKIGSIVAIEPSTGEILCLVSSPSYNPNMLVGRAVRKNYPVLSRDSLNPLFNRATMAQYPPGSIFKTIQALIGMQEGVINEKSGFSCIKSLVGCHNHPTATDVASSIKMSCNPYYFQVFKKIIQQNKAKSIYKDSEIGLAEWNKRVKKFGFGGTLQTDIPGVKNGLVPGVEFYNKWYGEGRWAFSTIFSLSIGQGELGVIPIQMANLAAIIANRGYYYQPHILKEIDDKPSIPLIFKQKNYVDIEAKYFEPIIEGMYGVVQEAGGTARRAKINGIEVCGKTGTAQNPHGEDHSVFIAFAPKDNPKIAIAVYVENAGFGGTWAAPIASLMMEKYLTDSISDKIKEQRILEANLMNVIPKK
ncbi:MAG: penicillin-binding protein 2 [Bacteroidetes bacterium HGW-Bacteroidetes-12]|nr:MAG: penicillin-binding protein 2 [Bacteroidetes bacterium HGW-Bacteroidetes-12]